MVGNFSFRRLGIFRSGLGLGLGLGLEVFRILVHAGVLCEINGTHKEFITRTIWIFFVNGNHDDDGKQTAYFTKNFCFALVKTRQHTSY